MASKPTLTAQVEHLTTSLGKEILLDCVNNPFRKCREGKADACKECICDQHNPVNSAVSRLAGTLGWSYSMPASDAQDKVRRLLHEGRWDTSIPGDTSILIEGETR